MIIDLDKVDWERIQVAADQSEWMPNEYMRNEWVSDVCNFLKYGRPLEITLAMKTETRVEELEDMLSRLVKENDLAMPNENYQWMYSPMRVECLKLLENK